MYSIIINILFIINIINGRNLFINEREYCLSNDSDPYLLFSTKTPYNYIKKNEKSPSKCNPIQIWMLARHGTRYPSLASMEKMKKVSELKYRIIQNYESNDTPIDDALCYDDYTHLKKWLWDESIEIQPKHLNEQGSKDLQDIAKRLKLNYPEILNRTYTPDDFYFRHTHTGRTEDSCTEFIDGLFGENAYIDVKIEQPIKHDKIIQTYSRCRAWKKHVSENTIGRNEKNIFKQSIQYKKLQSDVSKRLGFTVNLNNDAIESIYDICRNEKSRFTDRISPWCSVFSKEELSLLEYQEDLWLYYYSGYGHELNSKLGCYPLKHLRETFEKTILNNGSASPKLIAMFSHDIMVDMMLTALNYSKDHTDLSGSNFEDQLIHRKYRSSLNIPFAANILAVLYECNSTYTEKYQVQFFINERLMNLKGCNKGLCNWNFLQTFLSFTKKCNIDICDEDPN